MTQKTGWTPDPDDSAPETAFGPDAPEDGRDPSTIAVLLRLYDEGRGYVAVELERQKLRARLLARAGLVAALLVAAALFLLMGALVSLLIGLIWAIAPYIGPLGATLAVFAGTLLLILLLALAARRHMRATLRRLFAPEGQP